MYNMTGYDQTRVLAESARSILIRAQRVRDQQPVILKLLKQTCLPAEQVAWLRREFELLCLLADIPGVVRAYDLEMVQNHWVLVLEDTGGESLHHHLQRAGSLDMRTLLRLALSVTETLGQIHQHQVIHKDLTPHNVVYNPECGQVQLIDFGIATRLPRENAVFGSPTVLEGTLPYLAPEQTGRMNRAVDYRSDFYSLGVTLYELLTGQLPFVSDDPLELIHSHIARSPVPPQQIRAEIPEMLAVIILKLLAKDADARYQSAYGLYTDLAECLRQLEATGRIAPFVIGQNDMSDQFSLPQQLYGREAELATLLDSFDQVVQGSSALLLVAGAPGIGKTALVQEVYRPLTKRRGTFIAGKFDQVQHNVPYLAFVQAFRRLIRSLLTEPEAVLVLWRERLLTALGGYGQVIMEILPDLELIIGPQPPVLEAGPQEAQNRLLQLFGSFLKVFTRPEHPLVLFLDDLQWADSASLTLLAQLLSRQNNGYLFVIGAYRDTEVPSGHPLWHTLDVLRQAGVMSTTRVLSALDVTAVTALVRDALHVDTASAEPLAALLLRKTGGNPFFVGEFLKALHVESLLRFVPGRGWCWDLAEIEARQMTANVVELMSRQVQRLPDTTRQALQRAACIGSRFDLVTLAAVGEQPIADIARYLEPALLAGLIEPLNADYQVIIQEGSGLGLMVQAGYRFAHDRVQQAAYEQMTTEERAAQHWSIGHQLLLLASEEERSERLFDIVSQINCGRSLASVAERLELVHLNLAAGRKARAAVAYHVAYDYLQVALECLAQNSWQTHYALTLALYTELTEAAYLCHDIEAVSRFAALVEQYARTFADTIPIQLTQAEALGGSGHYTGVIQANVRTLARLGFHLPQRVGKLTVVQELLRTRWILRSTPVQSLAERSVMADAQAINIMRLLSQLFYSSYVTNGEIFALCVLKAVQLSVQYGTATVSAYVYAFYGVLLGSLLKDYDGLYRFGQMARHLADQPLVTTRKAEALIVVYFFTTIFREPWGDNVQPLRENYHQGIKDGTILAAAVSLALSDVLAFLSNAALPALLTTLAADLETVTRANESFAQTLIRQFYQAALNLSGQSDNPTRLSGVIYDETVMLPRHREASEYTNLFTTRLLKLMLCYLFGQIDEALAQLPELRTRLSAVIGTPYIPVYHFYVALTCIAAAATAPPWYRRRLLRQAVASERKLKVWSQQASMNFRHKWHLVVAERYRVQGQPGLAWEHYQHAISGACEHSYVQEEALACELLGRFLLARGLEAEARLSLHWASTTYARWGATARLQHLEQEYADLFARTAPENIYHSLATGPLRPTTISAMQVEALDIASLLKAAQAISGEIALEKLLERLLLVVLENAGADRGMLLLLRDTQWIVVAEGQIDPAVQTVLQEVPLAQANLPHSLLSYVIRTQETVVLHDALYDGDFTQDAYIQVQQPRSVLALPLIQQTNLIGLLYLENRQTRYVFTPQRQEVLTLLSGQATIALEHARLYANLEQLVAERTANLNDALSQVQEAKAQIEQWMNARADAVRAVVHDLNHTVQSIQSALDIWQLELQETQLDQTLVTTGHQRLKTALEQQRTLLQEMREAALLESGNLVLQPAATDLGILAQQVADQLRPRFDLAECRLVVTAAGDTPLAWCDAARIQRVLYNVIENAFRYTVSFRDDGVVQVSVLADGDEVVCTVQDNGRGIAPLDLNRLGKKFARLERGEGHPEGMGLGLNFAIGIMRLSNGSLSLTSAGKGQGTTVMLRLPRLS